MSVDRKKCAQIHKYQGDMATPGSYATGSTGRVHPG